MTESESMPLGPRVHGITVYARKTQNGGILKHRPKQSLCLLCPLLIYSLQTQPLKLNWLYSSFYGRWQPGYGALPLKVGF